MYRAKIAKFWWADFGMRKKVATHGTTFKKSSYICTAKKGKVPEWSIGPHSKCGERATVPGVRIPLSPLNKAYK